MPICKVIPLPTKLHALSLIDSGLSSIRSAALAVGVAKSTLHDNLGKFRDSVEEFTKWCDNSEERRVRNVLTIAMQCKASTRDTALALSKIEGRYIDHHEVGDILKTAGKIATEQNSMRIPMRLVSEDKDVEKLPLANVQCAAFDEIFQGNRPVLVFLDPASGFCNLAATGDRTAGSWEEVLKALKGMGLDPKTTNTDGGKGVLKGIETVFPDSINLRDLFHVVAKLGKALRAFEGRCYTLIQQSDLAVSRGHAPAKIEEIKRRTDRAITVFDALEAKSKRFRSACYCENEDRYVYSTDLEVIIKKIVALIECAERNGINHRAVKEARTYFQGATSAIIAYKSLLEANVKSIFGELNSLSVLDSICPMIEFLDQIQRSYENLARREFWAKKLARLRASFREFGFINQEEVDDAINAVAQVMVRLRKSNSLVESLNSVIRRYLAAYKTKIPAWFCPLFTFYWNHKTMPRGKRAKLKPREILTGQEFERDWLDIIWENWPAVSDDQTTEVQPLQLQTGT